VAQSLSQGNAKTILLQASTQGDIRAILKTIDSDDFYWLRPITEKTLDEAFMEEYSDAMITEDHYNPLEALAHLGEASRMLDACVSLKQAIHDLESRAMDEALRIITIKSTSEFNESIDEASFRADLTHTSADSIDASSVRDRQNALDELLLARLKLMNQPGSALNYGERVAQLRGTFIQQLSMAYRRLAASQKGLASVYGLRTWHLPIWGVDRNVLRELVIWVRRTIEVFDWALQFERSVVHYCSAQELLVDKESNDGIDGLSPRDAFDKIVAENGSFHLYSRVGKKFYQFQTGKKNHQQGYENFGAPQEVDPFTEDELWSRRVTKVGACLRAKKRSTESNPANLLFKATNDGSSDEEVRALERQSNAHAALRAIVEAQQQSFSVDLGLKIPYQSRMPIFASGTNSAAIPDLEFQLRGVPLWTDESLGSSISWFDLGSMGGFEPTGDWFLSVDGFYTASRELVTLSSAGIATPSAVALRSLVRDLILAIQIKTFPRCTSDSGPPHIGPKPKDTSLFG
jgi:hypothetical protein